MDRKKLLFIDGSSMLVTSYYGNLPKEILFERDEEKKKLLYGRIMHTEDGVYTNALFAMIRTLMKIWREQKPTHMLFAFDKTRNTFRREKFEDYKGQRKETPEPLKQQFAAMEDFLSALDFPVLVSDTYEADDLIGSAIDKFEKELTETENGRPYAPVMYVMTKDHDYLQLVDENVRLWLVQTRQDDADLLNERYRSLYGYTSKSVKFPDKVFEVTPPTCLAEYGVLPEQIPDLKGIQGDPSDNIPGIRGVAKPAIPLLREYGTLENIYAAIDDCGGDAKAEKVLASFWKNELGITRSPLKPLKEGREMGMLSKDLALIRRNAPVDVTLEDMEVHLDQEKLRSQLEKYEFRSLLAQLDQAKA